MIYKLYTFLNTVILNYTDLRKGIDVIRFFYSCVLKAMKEKKGKKGREMYRERV